MNKELYRLGNLQFRYNCDPVLNIPELSLSEGKVIVFRGHNGSGKTTLLKILGGLISPQSGEIHMNGSPADSQKLIAKSVLVHQEPYLFHGSVYQNLISPLKFLKKPPHQREKLVHEALNMVNLGGFEKRKARELSGGEKKRVAIARALLTDPEVLLLDEPDANVDKDTSRELEKLILLLRDKGMSIILCSHNSGFAYRTSDEIIDLYQGEPFDHSENIFKGSFTYTEDLFSSFQSGGYHFRCPSRQGDYSSIVISAKDVSVAREYTEGENRNQFKGTLLSIEPYKEERYTLILDCGVIMKSRINRTSLEMLGAGIGDSLFALFNPAAVRLY